MATMVQVNELRRRFQCQVDYSIALARIIEALCYGHDIPKECDAQAPHHTEMAREKLKSKNKYLKYKY